MSRFDDLARIFKALSDPNRLAILQLLRERCGPGCTLSRVAPRHPAERSPMRMPPPAQGAYSLLTRVIR